MARKAKEKVEVETLAHGAERPVLLKPLAEAEAENTGGVVSGDHLVVETVAGLEILVPGDTIPAGAVVKGADASADLASEGLADFKASE